VKVTAILVDARFSRLPMINKEEAKLEYHIKNGNIEAYVWQKKSNGNTGRLHSAFNVHIGCIISDLQDRSARSLFRSSIKAEANDDESR